MSEQQRSQRVLGTFAAGMVIGIVGVVFAISFATLVFGGRIESHLSDGIGLYLVAAALALGLLAWRAGARGVVGSVQDAAAAVLAVVATTTALDAFGSPDRAFLTVVAATLVVTVLTGVAFFALGTFRLGNLIRFVPYPVDARPVRVDAPVAAVDVPGLLRRRLAGGPAPGAGIATAIFVASSRCCSTRAGSS